MRFLTSISCLPGATGTWSAHAEKQAYIDSDEAAYESMQSLPADEPFHMLNMIRFNAKAKYPAGSEFAAKGWTGEEAYAEYSRHCAPIANWLGGEPLYGAAPQVTVIGPQDERWDVLFVVSYPSFRVFKVFKAFLSDPAYQKHAFRRSAAVADSRLIRMKPVSIQPPS